VSGVDQFEAFGLIHHWNEFTGLTSVLAANPVKGVTGKFFAEKLTLEVEAFLKTKEIRIKDANGFGDEVFPVFQ